MVPTRIYLTGFMGSGKSTLGPLLAERLHYRFADLDDEIEKAAGRSIREVFQEEGEAAFRVLERAALEQVATRDEVVVAVGGGALTFEHNLHVALASGAVFYLRVSAEELVRRLGDQAALRPLLQDEKGHVLSKKAMSAKITAMLRQRGPFYERAHAIIDLDGLTVEEACDALEAAVASATGGRSGGDRG